MATSYSVTDQVRGDLAAAMLEEEDLFRALEGHHPAESSERPGLFHCSVSLAVRRPFDPETSVLRRIRVGMRQAQVGWQIVSVTGLGEDE